MTIYLYECFLLLSAPVPPTATLLAEGIICILAKPILIQINWKFPISEVVKYAMKKAQRKLFCGFSFASFLYNVYLFGDIGDVYLLYTKRKR